MTWEFLRLRGVLPHSPVMVDMASLPHFFWQEDTPSCLHLCWALHIVAPHPCVTHACAVDTHTGVGTAHQQASVKVSHASLLSHSSSPCVPSSGPAWCFHSLLMKAELLKIQKHGPQRGMRHKEGPQYLTP